MYGWHGNDGALINIRSVGTTKAMIRCLQVADSDEAAEAAEWFSKAAVQV